MWIALPVAIFCASYAASAVGVVAGQAAFTVMAIIIFNLQREAKVAQQAAGRPSKA
jgi:hypothetical protein